MKATVDKNISTASLHWYLPYSISQTLKESLVSGDEQDTHVKTSFFQDAHTSPEGSCL